MPRTAFTTIRRQLGLFTTARGLKPWPSNAMNELRKISAASLGRVPQQPHAAPGFGDQGHLLQRTDLDRRRPPPRNGRRPRRPGGLRAVSPMAATAHAPPGICWNDPEDDRRVDLHRRRLEAAAAAAPAIRRAARGPTVPAGAQRTEPEADHPARSTDEPPKRPLEEQHRVVDLLEHDTRSIGHQLKTVE